MATRRWEQGKPSLGPSRIGQGPSDPSNREGLGRWCDLLPLLVFKKDKLWTFLKVLDTPCRNTCPLDPLGGKVTWTWGEWGVHIMDKEYISLIWWRWSLGWCVWPCEEEWRKEEPRTIVQRRMPSQRSLLVYQVKRKKRKEIKEKEKKM